MLQHLNRALRVVSEPQLPLPLAEVIDQSGSRAMPPKQADHLKSIQIRRSRKRPADRKAQLETIAEENDKIDQIQDWRCRRCHQHMDSAIGCGTCETWLCMTEDCTGLGSDTIHRLHNEPNFLEIFEFSCRNCTRNNNAATP